LGRHHFKWARNNQRLYPKPDDDLYTIIYTSGTTGDPKGVMHTVNNFMESVKAIHSVSFRGSFKTIFLLTNCPYSRTCIENISIAISNSSFPESLQSIASDLEKAQPNLFFAGAENMDQVSREKILEKIPNKKLSMLLRIPVVNSIIKKNYNRN
jgi:long-chain acyl-CoA synthetase